MGLNIKTAEWRKFDRFTKKILKRKITFSTMLLCLVAALLIATVNGDAIHQDSRCNCVCPDPVVSQSGSNPDELIGDRRTIYINSSVTPEQCTCPNVVLIHLNLTDTEAESFCPRCLCKYQTRSLTVIKVVVILVIWVVSLLLFYMAFLTILEPMLSKKRMIPSGMNRSAAGAGIAYSEHHDSTNESDDGGNQTDAESTQMSTYRGAEGVI